MKTWKKEKKLNLTGILSFLVFESFSKNLEFLSIYLSSKYFGTFAGHKCKESFGQVPNEGFKLYWVSTSVKGNDSCSEIT